MSHFDTAAAVSAIMGSGLPPESETTERAGELLGGLAGMWLHWDLWQWLERHRPETDEDIIRDIIWWETSNPDKLSDPGLRAVHGRDPRLGHIPAAQRKLFHERWRGRCPQCGEKIGDEASETNQS